MKKTLLNSFISLYLAACGSLHAADPDLVKGVDFTGASSFAPSQLNQLVDNAYVGPYRGMIIYTNSEPIASVITKYQRYLWLDTRTALPTPKVWNTNGYWTNIVATAVIADYSVTTDKIATNAVTNLKIADNAVTAAKIQDATITGAKIGSATITSTNIVAGTITSANIGNLQVGSANIAAAAITGDKIAANSIGTYMLTNGFALAGSNILSGTISSANIGQGGIVPTNVVASPTALYVPRVNGATTGFEWASPGLLQLVSTNRTDLVTCATAIPTADTVPQNTEGDEVYTLTITPKSASSKLVITFNSFVSAATDAFANVALFQDSTAGALSASSSKIASSGYTVPLTLRHVMTSGTTSSTTFKIRVGGSSTIYVNGSGASRLFNGIANASFSVEEIY